MMNGFAVINDHWINEKEDPTMNIALKARENMVLGQLMPDGVSDPNILDAFQSIPRDIFVPELRRGYAYVDEDIMIDDQRFILAPSVHARMIQALNLQKDEAVLDIACATGYSSTILSHLTKTVVAITNDQKITDTAKQNCEALSLYNIAFFTEELLECCPEFAPYPAIIFNGALAELPSSVLDSLMIGGRLVYIERPVGAPIGTAILIEKIADGKTSRLPLFQAATPYLPGFTPGF